MTEVLNIDECLIELAPYGSFPAWSFKDMQKAELPPAGDVPQSGVFSDL